MVAALAATAVLPATALAAPASVAPQRVVVDAAAPRCAKLRPAALYVGGSCGWTTTLRFELDGPARRALLSVGTRGGRRLTVTAGGRRVGSVRRNVALDVTRALDGEHLTVVLRGSRRQLARIARRGVGAPRLRVTWRASAPAPIPAAASAAAAPARPAIPQVDAGVVWVSPGELAARSTSSAAWTRLRARADRDGSPDIADQNSNHDVDTLAAALVFARTGDESYRAKAHAAVLGAIGTEAGGRTLALGRNLASYVIAADLIDLPALDPAGDLRFRTWLAAVRFEELDGLTLVSTHERRPNNWGTMAGASRIAADLYLGDQADLARAATVLRGLLGDRSAYAGFVYGDLSWQADPAAPVGLNPRGATIAGIDVDGALPDDMRRGCSFQPAPCPTGYPWEAMQGITVQAELLARHGYDAFGWSDEAVLRAAQYLQRLDAQFGGWWTASDDTWQPWLLNHAYGTTLPTTELASPGKVFGFADWVYGT